MTTRRNRGVAVAEACTGQTITEIERLDYDYCLCPGEDYPGCCEKYAKNDV